jgi:hypothetical protein
MLHFGIEFKEPEIRKFIEINCHANFPISNF